MDLTISEYFKKNLSNEDDDGTQEQSMIAAAQADLNLPQVNSEKELETAQENVDYIASRPSNSPCTPEPFRCHNLGEYFANEEPVGMQENSMMGAVHAGTDFALITSESQGVEEVQCSEPLAPDVNNYVYFKQQDKLRQTQASVGHTDGVALPNQHTFSHTKEKHFTCSQCDKTFKRNFHLKRHILSHTRQKPFVCAECEQRFNRKDVLTRHMITHMGGKPCSSSQSGKGFLQNSDLKIHIRTHTRPKTL